MYTTALPYKNNTNKYKLFVLILLCKNKLTLNFFRLTYEIIELDTNFYFPKNIKIIDFKFFDNFFHFLKKIIIPNTVITVYNTSHRIIFENLDYIYIPKSVEFIAKHTFCSKTLTNIKFEPSDTGSLFIENNAFICNDSVKFVRINRKKLTLSGSSFSSCTKISIH